MYSQKVWLIAHFHYESVVVFAILYESNMACPVHVIKQLRAVSQ